MKHKETIYPCVMIIDDNPTDRFLAKRIIEIINYAEHVITFQDGADAFAYFKEMADKNEIKQIPELIFLDLNMPVMDGFEFLEAYTKLPESIIAKPQITILTSSDDDDDRKRAYRYKQVSRFLSKPINKDILLDMAFMKEPVMRYKLRG